MLGRAAEGFRFGHTLIAVVELVGLGYVWTCALVRRRDRLLRFSVAALLAEGAALVIGRETAPSDRCSAEWATPSRCSSSCSHPGRRRPPFPFLQPSPWLASPYSPSDRRCPKNARDNAEREPPGSQALGLDRLCASDDASRPRGYVPG